MAKTKKRRTKAKPSLVTSYPQVDKVVDIVEAPPVQEPISVVSQSVVEEPPPELTAEAKDLIAQRVNTELWGDPDPSVVDKMRRWLEKRAEEERNQW